MNLDKRLVDCSLGELSDLVKAIIITESKPKVLETNSKGKYMTEKEVLAFYGIKETALRNWVNKKLITKYKVVGNSRYLTSEVEKLIQPT